uniref:Mitochondrial carrier protein n=1 Tax=Brassica campestris TaxID=3711 RepID=M4F7M0_BRACM|nr:unnamed protein product [Brassica rapa]
MDKLLENHEFATHAVAASASVSLGTGLAYPLDTIKTIIQVGCKKLTPCQVVNRVFRVSGYSGLYSGLGWLTLGRISGVGASSEEEVGPLSPVAISIAAGFSGAIAAAASHSFDTARTRAQCVILPKRKFLKWNKPGKRLERWTGILPTDRTLLFRGIGTRMARSSVASTVIVGMILLSCRFIGSK